MKHYTGVGSRSTPQNIQQIMKAIALRLAGNNIVLRSGGASGADTAFESGCAKGPKEIYLARDCTPEAMAVAARFHPAWHACNDFARKLHGRNAFQVLGKMLNTPSKCLICWTPDGCTSHTTRSRATGGTGTAISIAEAYNVPIYNLAVSKHLHFWQEALG
jgi:hypothetical protein